jgi:hypothetical protein
MTIQSAHACVPSMVLTAFAIAVAACGHEKLDFALPDAGRGGAHAQMDGAPPGTEVPCASSDWRCRDFVDSAGLDVDSPKGIGGSGLSAGAASGSNAGVDGAVEHADRYQDDPRGYPAGPAHLTLACASGQSIPEVCANDLDDDCDGTVDEYPGIGAPCVSGCGQEGIYVCDAETNALLCRGPQGCRNEVPPLCGDGLPDSHEECDPNAPSEVPGVTCTLSCTRPLFVRCVQAGAAFPERCDDLHACDERVGACVPVIGPRQRRCPQLRIEGASADDEFYPMLEMENGECWVTCSESDQCPSSLSQCYMGFCVVPF